MSYIIAFSNQKGGVGKTTSAVNCAACLGAMGKRVLIADLDPQGNATSGVGVSRKCLKLSSYDMMSGDVPAEKIIQHTAYENLDILPSQISLAGSEFELVEAENREYIFRNAIEPVKDKYDIIIVDCPPSLGILSINALSASDGVIIPMQCEYYALEGLSQLIMTVRQIKKLYNPKLEITGILITMYNGRLNLSVQVLDEIKKYYADKLFHTIVPRSVRLSEAPSYGEPIIYYDKNSKGAEAYKQIAKEISDRTY